jgi:hypothetical protein
MDKFSAMTTAPCRHNSASLAWATICFPFPAGARAIRHKRFIEPLINNVRGFCGVMQRVAPTKSSAVFMQYIVIIAFELIWGFYFNAIALVAPSIALRVNSGRGVAPVKRQRHSSLKSWLV